mmetsp:Transcript_15365/g.20190  ORF Transcript_15365/g.20190 Transcript_15365/m.20190 type:complete len:114 (-) Transcript_15365:381-722(-)
MQNQVTAKLTEVQGSCLCSEVQYEAKPPFYHETNCHCSMCRRSTGAPYVTWFSAKRDRFRWLKGKPQVYQSSALAVRMFCGNCGTQLAFEVNDSDEIDLTTGSLNDPSLLPPR